MASLRVMMIAKRVTGLISYIAVALFVNSGTAAELSFSPDLKQQGWKVYTPRGKSPAEFDVEADGALTIRADSAVAFLYREVPKDLRSASQLSWQWRVRQDMPGTDLSQPGADDRPLAIHVYFSDDDVGLMRRFSGGLGRMFGVPVSGRAITYVWGGLRDEGSILINPFMDDGEGVLIIRRRSGSTPEEWISETVDLSADYRAAFGTEAGPVVAIAVSSDTDDTASQAEARVKDLNLDLPLSPAR